ncbi:hypothetical protein Ddc_23778 [Ditylenchus destructor]|nr:hypothetical protein Ddc_23778 [Ditylenchus destructor]
MDNVDLLLKDGTYKELTWVFLFGELGIAYQLIKIVVALIQELEKRFWESKNPRPYKFWMLNVFHLGTLPEASFKESTEDMLMFEKDVFGSKRYHSGLEESAFHPGSIDIKVERTFIADDISCPSMVSMGSDSACSSSEFMSEDEMSI